MRQDKFKKLMGALDYLTPRQRQKVVETLSEKTPLDDTLEVVNSREVNHQRCPNCQHDQLNKWGQKDGVQRYRCKSCNKTCNALTRLFGWRRMLEQNGDDLAPSKILGRSMG